MGMGIGTRERLALTIDDKWSACGKEVLCKKYTLWCGGWWWQRGIRATVWTRIPGHWRVCESDIYIKSDQNNNWVGCIRKKNACTLWWEKGEIDIYYGLENLEEELGLRKKKTGKWDWEWVGLGNWYGMDMGHIIRKGRSEIVSADETQGGQVCVEVNASKYCLITRVDARG